MTDDTIKIVPVVLSGGSGTRLWPASRARQPKQLLSLVSRQSMIADTIDRLDALQGVVDPIIVTNTSQADRVAHLMAQSRSTPVRLILEPVGRNTAPAIAIASLLAIDDDPDATLLVLPADHAISDRTAFAEAVAVAASAAGDGLLATFGITPTAPETGYGYIKAGSQLRPGVWEIAAFKEKPDAPTAQAYLDSGAYSWNSGMFVFRADVYLRELEAHRPDIAAVAKDAYAGAERSHDRLVLSRDTFAESPAVSIDYAVMEQTTRGAIIPVDPGWSDVGSWASVWEIGSRDEHGNVIVGNVTAVDTTDSYVRSDGRLVATVGVQDLVIVDTTDALLVTTLEGSQDVRSLVDAVAAVHPTIVETDGSEDGEWGRSRVVASGPGHGIRLIEVDPAHHMSIDAAGRRVVLQILDDGATIATDGTEHQPSAGSSFAVEPDAHVHVVNRAGTPLRLFEISVDTFVSPADIDRFTEGRPSP